MGGGSLAAAASTSELRGQGVNVRGGDEAMPGGGGADSFDAARRSSASVEVVAPLAVRDGSSGISRRASGSGI